MLESQHTRRGVVSRRRFLVVAGALLGGVACVPPAPPTGQSGQPPTAATTSAPAAPPAAKPTSAAGAQAVAQPTGAAQQAPAAPAAGKTIVVGQGFEITGLGWVGRVDTEATHVAQAGLITRDTEKYQIIPWMAEELPSTDKGTWKVNPDGTMETVYKLRPGIKWHDGKDLSSKDFVLGWQIVADPKVKIANRSAAADHIAGIDTPDDRTVLIRWKDKFPGAGGVFASWLPPMPRHLLEESYKAGKYDEINTSPYWNTKYVHAGPFKVVDFQPGSHVEFAANPDFFMGRPKVDRIIWRIIPDSNALLSAVLSNEVDVTMRAALTVENGIVADREWASKGQGTVKFSPTNWTWLGPDPNSPIFGWKAPNQNQVRQAMLLAVDRQAIVDTLFAGKETPLDFPLSPVRPAYAAAKQAAKSYPYDAKKAEQLLDDAGWKKGSDGVRVNSSGERFSVEFSTTAGQKDMEQLQGAIASYLKAVGIETKVANLTDRVLNDADHRNHWSGLRLASHNIQTEDWSTRFASEAIPTEANQWLPLNQSGWNNPRVDEIIKVLDTTLDEKQRNDLTVEWLKTFGDELPVLPIKYNAECTSYRTDIKNVPVRLESGGENYRTWNIHLWEKTA